MLRRLNQWWRNNPENAIDWGFNFGVLEHYFPNIDVGSLTLDNYWEKLKLVKKLIGDEDGEETTEEQILSPEEWFKRAMEGQIQPDNGVTPVDAKAKQMHELRKLGFIR